MSKPTLTVFAGPNGSGKTSLYKSAMNEANKVGGKKIPGMYINTDDLAASLGSERAGARAAILLRKELISQKQSLVVETSLAGKGPLKLMEKAKKEGYQVSMHYVGTSNTPLNRMRVQERVAKGGHSVKAEDIQRRHIRAKDNLYKASHVADNSYVYDNSGNKPELLLSKRGHNITHVKPTKLLPSWVPKQLQQLPKISIKH